jgi:DNA-binding NarL/FixJ family response regulator
VDNYSTLEKLDSIVAEGKANKRIVAELDISIKTVEKHRQGLMAKLVIHDTDDLARGLSKAACRLQLFRVCLAETETASIHAEKTDAE